MFYGVFGTERVMGRCVCGGRGGGDVFSGKDDISLLRRQLSEAKLWLYLATIGKNDANEGNEGSMMAMVVMIEVADRSKKNSQPSASRRSTGNVACRKCRPS